MEENILLRLESLVVGYSGRVLSSPMTLEIPVGSRVGVIGANGSGKTTLIKTLLGLIPPLSGTCAWKTSTTFGYVPQENQIDPLFPLTIEDLLKMGVVGEISRFRRSTPAFKEASDSILIELGITEGSHRLVRELSGGQRQRALIARALMGRPQVLLMDEPFSYLDYVFQHHQKELFHQWQKKYGFSLFLVEHDLNVVINQVDWIILLGRSKTLAGKTSEILTEETLSEAYGTKLHIHKENHELQIHFL